MPGSRNGAQICGAQDVTGWQYQFRSDNVFPQRADVRPRGDAGTDADGNRITDGIGQFIMFIERFSVLDGDRESNPGGNGSPVSR